MRRLSHPATSKLVEEGGRTTSGGSRLADRYTAGGNADKKETEVVAEDGNNEDKVHTATEDHKPHEMRTSLTLKTGAYIASVRDIGPQNAAVNRKVHQQHHGKNARRANAEALARTSNNGAADYDKSQAGQAE